MLYEIIQTGQKKATLGNNRNRS